MTKKGKKHEAPKKEYRKCRTCRHAISVGNVAVDVHPTCPHFHFMHGRMVVTKQECERCDRWEARDDAKIS